MLRKRQRKSFWKNTPTLILSVQETDIFKPEEEAEIVEEINNSGADIVFVCLGAPKQEQWIERNRDAL